MCNYNIIIITKFSSSFIHKFNFPNKPDDVTIIQSSTIILFKKLT